ncbi:protein RD3-like [Acanthaster planci]|uniref:Protein RD3-like n=1 Tax=Acanthaster planci TaxID=133434 RepID=A0A8B7YZI7_ACAPL|nr:protein RD3-like [Acanthaster planci]XP_022098768.1 protein RD3-like [Acanthaster planci]XP_022098769.1 protein RD3-like [Acanthaster planci]
MSMPLSSLFRSNEIKLSEKNEASVVRDCLMGELEYQMRERQHTQWQREEDRKKKQGVADYSWLVSTPPKYYAPPQLQLLQLEELCSEVRPAETGRVINRFREVLVREPRVEEIPLLLKAVMHQVIQERPQEETLGEWVAKRTTSLTRLRSNVRVSPLNTADAGDMDRQVTQRSLSMPEFSTRTRTSQPRSLAEFCTNFDDLPV